MLSIFIPGKRLTIVHARLRPTVHQRTFNIYVIYTVICKSLHTASVAKQVSVAVGWVKIKISLIAQLKVLTDKFKLM